MGRGLSRRKKRKLITDGQTGICYTALWIADRKEAAVKSLKGLAVFLAQFLRDEPPFYELQAIGKWFSELGYQGL